MEKVPYETLFPWKSLEQGKEPILRCQGCDARVEDSDGYNSQHTILDCVQHIKENLQSQIDDLWRALEDSK